MPKLRIRLPDGVTRVYALTSFDRWKPQYALKARTQKGWRWATISNMPKGAYNLVTDKTYPNETFEAIPGTEPEMIKIRFFSGEVDEEIRPEVFKRRKKWISKKF